MIKCNTCNKLKLVSEFKAWIPESKRKRKNKKGRRCKACFAEARSKLSPSYHQIQECKRLHNQNQKRCKDCKYIKDLSEFQKSGLSPYTDNQKYRSQCRDCVAIYDAKRYPKIRHKQLAQSIRWQKNNKHKVSERRHMRWMPMRELRERPGSLEAAHREEREAIFKKAQELTEKTGIKHVVDHIIPRKHKHIWGLNVPWNLQILPATKNNRKRNKFDNTYENNSWRKDLLT